MANMNPVGVDQTTGQQRPVSNSDNLTNNLGDTIEVVVTKVHDFSGNVRNSVQAVFPWSTSPSTITPATLPTGTVDQVAWSPNGEFLSVVSGANSPPDTNPTVRIYQRTGNTFNKLPDPASLPGVRGNRATVDWSPDGQFMAVGCTFAPRLSIYQRDGSIFTRLADPADVPGFENFQVSFSHNGEFLVTLDSGSPYIRIYQRDGTTFTKLPDPASLPEAVGAANGWTENDEFLAIGTTNTPGTRLIIYQRSGATFTRLADPASIPTASLGNLAWSPNGGEFLVTDGGAMHVYQRSGTTLTLLATPASFPSSTNGIAWSPTGKHLALAFQGIRVYRREGTTFTLTDIIDNGSVYNKLAWSPDGQFLAVPVNSSSLKIFQTTESMPTTGIMITSGKVM